MAPGQSIESAIGCAMVVIYGHDHEQHGNDTYLSGVNLRTDCAQIIVSCFSNGQ